MGIFLGFGFLGTRGFGAGLLLGFKIHQGGCLGIILNQPEGSPKRPLVPPTGTPVLLHPDLSVRDAPNLAALV